ncbi:hypothetical protein AAG570_003213, partial [Ranatra chinensis]
ICLGRAHVYHNLGCQFYAVAVAGLGPDGVGYNRREFINECKENVRIAASVGVRALLNMGVTDIMVEGLSNAEAAAEGAALALWEYDGHKNLLALYDDPDCRRYLRYVPSDGWEKGLRKAEAQNFARKLEDAPSNLMTPSAFSRHVIEELCPCNVQVDVREKDWLQDKCWTAFLSMAKGSCEPPIVLEIAYCGGAQDDRPVVLIGKGITYDSGGLCLRHGTDMSEYRADMAGAAVIVATIKALASLSIPINVNAMIPLCENMPGGMAPKPGDVVHCHNGKTIRLQDTSKLDRVILADPLAYSANYKPCLTITIATLTSGMRTALGASSTGVFTTSDVVWDELCRAGAETGDRVWRFPLWNYFTKHMTDTSAVDVCNVGLGLGGEPCRGAAFLMEFAPRTDFVHMDITGTGMVSSGLGYPYLREGTMTGRPTRTLVQFLYQMSCPTDKCPAEC